MTNESHKPEQQEHIEEPVVAQETEQVVEEVTAQQGNDETDSVDDQADVESLTEEQQRIIELEQKLATALATVDDQKDSVIRAKAEMDNIRRRSAQEVDKAKKFALEKFAAEMLTVVDNLERGLATINADDENQKATYEGVNLTLQGLLSGLDKFGVKAIDPQDQPFNPEQHQAMSMQPVEGVEANTVVAVMQKGYELNGRLIRPAMVMVSK
ncbi:nucleotide exchange factor GrpE [Thalassotalea ponticola]|uniref:nucleotide exchange factor GrpE n=1 Tax=Thalassotalea ponticola TaxID=1523392 RepID=UPI0025B5FE48|nr:nucleotide exchange factor GrpE [Thalassotalea ponticola]MDN3651747.1 nucleotide exchange factor GrpE [Thalassotalea ponticola]